jgi:hypothetical protein
MQTQPIRGFDPTPATFPEYSRTRTFTRVDDEPVHVNTSLTCQQILDAGGCTVDEFFDELDRRIRLHFHEKRNNLPAGSK